MLGWFRKLLPREDRFFDLFEQHSRTVVGGAEALQQLLGGKDVDRWCQKIIDLENEAGSPGGPALLHHALQSRRHQGPDPVDG